MFNYLSFRPMKVKSMMPSFFLLLFFFSERIRFCSPLFCTLSESRGRGRFCWTLSRTLSESRGRERGSDVCPQFVPEEIERRLVGSLLTPSHQSVMPVNEEKVATSVLPSNCPSLIKSLWRKQWEPGISR